LRTNDLFKEEPESELAMLDASSHLCFTMY